MPSDSTCTGRSPSAEECERRPHDDQRRQREVGRGEDERRDDLRCDELRAPVTRGQKHGIGAILVFPREHGRERHADGHHREGEEPDARQHVAPSARVPVRERLAHCRLLLRPVRALGVGVRPGAAHAVIERALQLVGDRSVEPVGSAVVELGRHLVRLERARLPRREQVGIVGVVDRAELVLVVRLLHERVRRLVAEPAHVGGVHLREREFLVRGHFVLHALDAQHAFVRGGLLLLVRDGGGAVQHLSRVGRRLRLHDVERHDPAQHHEDARAGDERRAAYEQLLELESHQIKHGIFLLPPVE